VINPGASVSVPGERILYGLQNKRIPPYAGRALWCAGLHLCAGRLRRRSRLLTGFRARHGRARSCRVGPFGFIQRDDQLDLLITEAILLI